MVTQLEYLYEDEVFRHSMNNNPVILRWYRQQQQSQQIATTVSTTTAPIILSPLEQLYKDEEFRQSISMNTTTTTTGSVKESNACQVIVAKTTTAITTVDKEENGLVVMTDHDIPCGRGAFPEYGATASKGTRRFRDLVALYHPVFVHRIGTLNSIAKMIVRTIRNKTNSYGYDPSLPSGRFLRKDITTGTWYDIGDKKAVLKTTQALRYKAAYTPTVWSSSALPLLGKKRNAVRHSQHYYQSMNIQNNDDDTNCINDKEMVNNISYDGDGGGDGESNDDDGDDMNMLRPHHQQLYHEEDSGQSVNFTTNLGHCGQQQEQNAAPMTPLEQLYHEEDSKRCTIPMTPLELLYHEEDSKRCTLIPNYSKAKPKVMKTTKTKATTMDGSNTKTTQPNLMSLANPSNTINITDDHGRPSCLNSNNTNNKPKIVMIGGGEEKKKQSCMGIVHPSLSHSPRLDRHPFHSGPRQSKEGQQQQSQGHIIPLLSSSSYIAQLQPNYKTSSIHNQIQTTQTYLEQVKAHYSQHHQSQHKSQLYELNDDDQQWIEFFENTNNFDGKDKVDDKDDDKDEREGVFYSSSMIKEVFFS